MSDQDLTQADVDNLREALESQREPTITSRATNMMEPPPNLEQSLSMSGIEITANDIYNVMTEMERCLRNYYEAKIAYNALKLDWEEGFNRALYAQEIGGKNESERMGAYAHLRGDESLMLLHRAETRAYEAERDLRIAQNRERYMERILQLRYAAVK